MGLYQSNKTLKKLSLNNTGIKVKSEWGKGSTFSFTLENKSDNNDMQLEL